MVSVGSDIAYTYDENGIRTTKEVDGTTTYFNTSDGVILSQSDDENTLIFQYDNGGLPVGFTWNGTQYYYLTNSSGDVLGICDTSGELLVEYTYDEWGKLIDLGISANADEDLAEINPLRYRGYYYDEETGFYYLQSRYYNPEICRFISQDSYTNTETGTSLQYNMFAYCENDPVNCDDPSGEAKRKNVYIYFYLHPFGKSINLFGHLDLSIAGKSYSYGSYDNYKKTANFFIANTYSYENYIRTKSNFYVVGVVRLSVTINEYKKIIGYYSSLSKRRSFSSKSFNGVYYKITKGKYIKYKYLTKNCATMVYDAIESAMKSKITKFIKKYNSFAYFLNTPRGVYNFLIALKNYYKM